LKIKTEIKFSCCKATLWNNGWKFSELFLDRLHTKLWPREI